MLKYRLFSLELKRHGAFAFACSATVNEMSNAYQVIGLLLSE